MAIEREFRRLDSSGTGCLRVDTIAELCVRLGATFEASVLAEAIAKELAPESIDGSVGITAFLDWVGLGEAKPQSGAAMESAAVVNQDMRVSPGIAADPGVLLADGSLDDFGGAPGLPVEAGVFPAALSIWCAAEDTDQAGMIRECQAWREVVDAFGARSAFAQALRRGAITTADGLLKADTRQVLYVLCDDACARMLGFLKVGEKHLYYADRRGYRELNPLCVLDFYVHESCQRAGGGKRLFETMLEHQALPARKFAYDRPSPKLLKFLEKHYGLVKYTPQPYNFVVFDCFFCDSGGEAAGAKA